MFEAPSSPYLVPFDGSFNLSQVSTSPTPDQKSGDLKDLLEDESDRLDDLQRALYAGDRHAVLLVFQAMDAAGKDSTIRAVLRGLNPAGCQVYSFKQPSKEELDHDFLWRSAKRLPERGRIGVFNRSYYEEVLVVRVHPEYLGGQRIPDLPDLETLWQQRYESIRDHELHLARNGTAVLKFWLNVSKDEQRSRFLDRIDEPDKNWKFSEGDVKERALWDRYMDAYQQSLNQTSRPWAPWYAVPADHKPFMRLTVAKIFRQALESLGVRYPEVDAESLARFSELRESLLAQE